MRYTFHSEAAEELSEGVHYYGKCQKGLGRDFAHEVYRAIQNATEHPRLWPEIAPNVRRILVHRFPYGVLYTADPEEIFILA